MKRYLSKKFKMSFGCIMILMALVLGTSGMCYATETTPYTFEKAWDGKGNAVLLTPWKKAEDLLEVSFGGVTLSADDYTVEPYFDEGLKLEIKESGMKKLPLKTGNNFITAKIAGRPGVLKAHEDVTLKDGETEVTFAKKGATEVQEIINWYGFDVCFPVDETDYTVEESDTEYTIKFNEDYLKTLDSKHFWIYCLRDFDINLQLIKGKMGDVNCDDKVDLSDAKEVLKSSLGVIENSEELKKLGDIDDDGKVDLKDAKAVLKQALGI